MRIRGLCKLPDGMSWLWGQLDLVPSKHLWRGWGLLLKVTVPLLPSYCGFSFALGCGVSFFGGFQHFSVSGCSAASCSFGVLAGEDECTSFYSAIFVAPPRIMVSSRSFEVGQIWIWVLASLLTGHMIMD